MNYQAIYDRLMERARHRELAGYVERHHVEPRCLGGTDDSTNIVELTAEEHYVAHQLLVKIHPGNARLLYAANMMTRGTTKTARSRNKQYSWLRKRHSEVMRVESKKMPRQKGVIWITDGNRSTRIAKEETIPEGWKLGRTVAKRYSDEELIAAVQRHGQVRAALKELGLSGGSHFERVNKIYKNASSIV